ncbi:MAG: Obg family GTPase CgtA [Patescibacteria group bacterium]
MGFIDELSIYVKAGDGGNGVVRWRHEKHNPLGGPSGGDGGRGGDVYIVAVRDIHLLTKYRNQKKFFACRGEDGQKNSLHGACGKDLDILLPIGSVVTNIDTKEKISLAEEGEKVLLFHGGAGGRGNESFKSSTDRSPRKQTDGKIGDEGKFFIELELIADIGLIGLPNAGKTSLLNALSHARGKVGAYPFTTLEPNLGECYGYIISDIPGLIEGASSGKGLGHKFLRHIKRTNLLAHLISLENDDPLKVYKVILKELKKYDKTLLLKKEIVILTKTDTVDEIYIEKVVKQIKKINPIVFTISMYNNESIKILRERLIKEVKK